MTLTRVRLAGIDREYCAIMDPNHPITSHWRVRFRLTPRWPGHRWCDYFEAAIRDRARANTLVYRHVLVQPRDARSNGYGYGPRRVRAGLRRFFARLVRRGGVTVDVVVPPSAEQVRAARVELSELMHVANEAMRAKIREDAMSHAGRLAAVDQLSHALHEIEREPVPMPDLTASRPRESNRHCRSNDNVWMPQNRRREPGVVDAAL